MAAPSHADAITSHGAQIVIDPSFDLMTADDTTAPQTSTASAKPVLACREIGPDDIDAVVELLVRGFPERDAVYWRRGLARHAAHEIPEGAPRYGFMMTDAGRAVGVVLVLFAPSEMPDGAKSRCNLSSWYVEPYYRPFSTILSGLAIKRGAATITNISPAPHTVPMHEARGFRPMNLGQVIAVPVLGRRVPGTTIEAVVPSTDLGPLSEPERRLLGDHAAYGCVCLIGRSRDGAATPFVLVRHPVARLVWKFGFSPVHYMQLVYCRSIDDLARFARPLGHHLLRRHGMICVVTHADAAIPDLPGRFVRGWNPGLARGPEPVRLGDVAYSELAVFGP